MNSLYKKSLGSLKIKRFAAFVIDMGVMALLLTSLYKLFGFPNFPVVMAAMAEANSKINTPEWQALVSSSLAIFNMVYIQALLVYFGYETITQLLFKGATVGKLILGLQVLPQKPDRKLPVHYLLMTLRSLAKIVLLYFLQGIPFIISLLTMFANPQSRTGYDFMVRTIVGEKTQKNSVSDINGKNITKEMIADVR